MFPTVGILPAIKEQCDRSNIFVTRRVMRKTRDQRTDWFPFTISCKPRPHLLLLNAHSFSFVSFSFIPMKSCVLILKRFPRFSLPTPPVRNWRKKCYLSQFPLLGLNHSLNSTDHQITTPTFALILTNFSHIHISWGYPVISTFVLFCYLVKFIKSLLEFSTLQ